MVSQGLLVCEPVNFEVRRKTDIGIAFYLFEQVVFYFSHLLSSRTWLTRRDGSRQRKGAINTPLEIATEQHMKAAESPQMAPLFPFQDQHHLLFLLVHVVLLALLIILYRRKKNGSNGVSKLPPGPPRLPLIGNLHQLGSSCPHRKLHQLALEHGPLMLLRLGRVQTLVVSSAEMAKAIIKTHDVEFSGRPVLYAANKFSYGCLNLVFSPYGEYWRQMRKLTMLELLSAKKVQSFRAVREEEVAHTMSLIARLTASHSPSVPVNLSEMMLALVNDIICQIVFGGKQEKNGSGQSGKSRFHEILRETQTLLGGFNISDFFPNMEWVNKLNGIKAKIDKNFAALDEFYDQVIKEHLHPERSETEHEDLVDVLLRIQKDPTLRIAITSNHIKGIITDMFIAGTDTSSSFLVWTMAELVRNPSVLRKAQEEVRRAIGKKDMVEESQLHQLNYLKLVVKEAFRLHPPAPLLVPHETTEKCTISGYEVPAKTRVFINATAIGLDGRSWHKPEEFRPERFLDKPIDYRGQDFELIPFGIGRRSCPGMNFASLLIELILANLLHHFDWELPHGMKREDVDMEEAFGLTIHKKTPLCLVARAFPDNI
ncbi:hypothetical protein ACLOJK_009178 [Asimina triloba]